MKAGQIRGLAELNSEGKPAPVVVGSAKHRQLPPGAQPSQFP
jgi:hypothetical protein